MPHTVVYTYKSTYLYIYTTYNIGCSSSRHFTRMSFISTRQVERHCTSKEISSRSWSCSCPSVSFCLSRPLFLSFAQTSFYLLSSFTSPERETPRVNSVRERAQQALSGATHTQIIHTSTSFPFLALPLILLLARNDSFSIFITLSCPSLCTFQPARQRCKRLTQV